MPKHKRESLIYTVMMCFVMVLWMSVYNVTLHMGQFGVETLKEAWLGFPVAYIFAMVFDWFVVSGPAKAFAFRFLVKPDSSVLQKAIAVSGCMVIPMVIIMSFYGGVGSLHKKRRMGKLTSDLADQYSKEFYYGTSISAVNRRSVGKKSISNRISGGNRTFKSKYLNVSNIP